MSKQTLRLKVNGKEHHVEAEDDAVLLWVLRDQLGLTGAKYGCGEGQCGACTVIMDDQAVFSCLLPAALAVGRNLETIEGQATGGRLSPVQQSFKEHSAFGCGFCTPGQIMRATALLRANPRATRAEIVDTMSANLCRCAAYPNILAAIEAVADPSK